ncbi:hypothetical protein TEA_002155 [Camellia sinensis var. sinensis]|uniref:Expansin-like EG45 domain-containing protein n=1 Tax=Camellia sinensis var. sinensis TaxID=542762 RepID=A0A4S4DYJ2_CAMSN|nr:hypothetical protein TEA_002155 [Camellia sinensis var. sinensis]
MIAAASDPLWNNGAICGKIFVVACTGATNPVPHPCTRNNVTVKIVDHCPGCGGTLDLSKEAFATIANTVAGVFFYERFPSVAPVPHSFVDGGNRYWLAWWADLSAQGDVVDAFDDKFKFVARPY